MIQPTENIRQTDNILGYQVSSRGVDSDVDYALELISNAPDKVHYAACANPHSLVVAEKDSEFKTALLDADILLPDGFGIIVASKILGLGISQRVAGMDLFLQLSQRSNQIGSKRFYFLGSSPSVLEQIRNRMAIDFPDIEVCGLHSPPYRAKFSKEENSQMIRGINNARPHVLWVGMTAPKQEKWIHENRDQLNVPFVCAIGAVFDFYSGSKKRAPQWICDLGLEWLPRLVHEPLRLWKRNFVSSPIFLFRVFCERMKRIR